MEDLLLYFMVLEDKLQITVGSSDQSTSVLCKADYESHMGPHIDHILLMSSVEY